MKFLLILASVICLALIVSARPSDETSDQESSTELSEDTSEDLSQEEETSEPDTEADTESSESDGESEGDTSELESSPEEDHSEETASDSEEESETTEDAGTEEQEGDTEDAASEEGEADEQGETGEQGETEGGEESPRNTYRQVHTLLKNIMKVGTKDKYLKSFILARLQERLMNPTIELVGSIEKYSKIKECFSSLAKDVGVMVKDSEKSYKECSKDKSNTNCGTDGTRDLDDGLIDREQQLMDCIVEKRDAE